MIEVKQSKSALAPIFFQFNNLFYQNPKQINQMQNQLKQKYIPGAKHYKQIHHVEIGLINDFKKFRFNADLGQYFEVTFISNLHARRIKQNEIGQILQIKDPKKQILKATQMVTQEFNCVKNLSNKIDQALRNTNKADDQIQISLYKNIKVNYFLKYQGLKIDQAFGCFLLHQPVLITLDEVIKKNVLDYTQKIEIMTEILKILQFLQELKICHRNITSYAFVLVNRNPLAKNGEFNKSWKYDKKQHEIKITGFYQAISIDANESQTQESIIFNNAYIDPNITNFKKPQFASDLWSVIILFYQIFTGKLPSLDNKWQLQHEMASMLGWQKDFFNFFFRGTKQVNITLKDLQMRVKNMGITSALTQKIILHKKQSEQCAQERMWHSLKQTSLSNQTSRRRVYSQYTSNNHH